MDRDAILTVDGNEILHYGRQSIQTYEPGHRINSGPTGCMGVGLPYAIGAKLAKPDKQVVSLHGDGSLGMNIQEFDTAVRYKLPMTIVVSNNEGWTARVKNIRKPGRELGYTQFDKLAEALGGYGENVEKAGGNPAGPRTGHVVGRPGDSKRTHRPRSPRPLQLGRLQDGIDAATTRR